MLCLSDFVAGRKIFYNLSMGLCCVCLCIKASKQIKFKTHIYITVANKINIVMLE